MAPRIDHYEWTGGREAMLRFGPDTGPLLVAALPLFEEANRTRTFAVTLLRVLATRGIASVLPDVPGQGESAAPLATLPDMAEALAAVPTDGRPTYALGLRSGALLDTAAARRDRWHFAPQTGEQLARMLQRTWHAAGNSGPQPDPVEIAGNVIPQAFLASLGAALPIAADRIVRLTSDPEDADRKVDAAPLWRRSEPGNDPALVEILADDIADWLARCEA
ncbi:hypothetical protein SFC76_10655 [Sphingomonas sp. CD22]|uniref:hypothetical protein n=1 Tax=Sphingomonas sp. CD22 TaxID=3100214 RepID=UPI002ADF299A|nr:hypothetical protein [Sphingomonas sp. CD22]MEA1084722.1 hypothetical protein [Sphingomonas sp. CD22]